jgi:hypothetical protein
MIHQAGRLSVADVFIFDVLAAVTNHIAVLWFMAPYNLTDLVLPRPCFQWRSFQICLLRHLLQRRAYIAGKLCGTKRNYRNILLLLLKLFLCLTNQSVGLEGVWGVDV